MLLFLEHVFPQRVLGVSLKNAFGDTKAMLVKTIPLSDKRKNWAHNSLLAKTNTARLFKNNTSTK